LVSSALLPPMPRGRRWCSWVGPLIPHTSQNPPARVMTAKRTCLGKPVTESSTKLRHGGQLIERLNGMLLSLDYGNLLALNPLVVGVDVR
jgi:hypothetical protein